jgi:peptidoglycan/xylan/chitin deacetylase (PgdA/CDA1 family)
LRLRGHGRYPYRAIGGRPDYSWPGGKRLAVYVALNLEHFSFGEGLGAELVPRGPEPDILNYAWRDYGNRVGAWRLIELFDQLRLPASALVNAALYGFAPELVAAFRRRGDEIVAHGFSNSERQADMSEEEERRHIAETTRIIGAAEGRPPAGWLGPWISESRATPDLLKEAGYRYVLDWSMDDQPVRLATRAGPLLAVPYPQELNDIPAIAIRRMTAPEFADMVVDQFEEMLGQSRHQPLVLGLALHAFIVGQPHRLRHLRRALERIAAPDPRVWLTTSGAVAEHALALPPGMVP